MYAASSDTDEFDGAYENVEAREVDPRARTEGTRSVRPHELEAGPVADLGRYACRR